LQIISPDCAILAVIPIEPLFRRILPKRERTSIWSKNILFFLRNQVLVAGIEGTHNKNSRNGPSVAPCSTDVRHLIVKTEVADHLGVHHEYRCFQYELSGSRASLLL
jgi:hypothetical protein